MRDRPTPATAGQDLAVAIPLHMGAVLVYRHIFAFRLTRGFLPVYVEMAFTHLDMVTGQPDDALDIVDRRILREAEDRHVATVGRMVEDPPLEQVG